MHLKGALARSARLGACCVRSARVGGETGAFGEVGRRAEAAQFRVARSRRRDGGVQARTRPHPTTMLHSLRFGAGEELSGIAGAQTRYESCSVSNGFALLHALERWFRLGMASGRRRRRSLIRVLRASWPIQIAIILVVLLGLFCLPLCCENCNNWRYAWGPQLDHQRPPPC